MSFLFSIFILCGRAQELTTPLPPLRIEEAREEESSALTNTNSGKSSSEDSFLEIPNLSVAGGTNRIRYLQIRGLGETSVYENTPSHSVGLWIDGIDVTGWLATWPQLNVKNLRVEAGPQSLEHGGFASAGSLQTTLVDDDQTATQLVFTSANEIQTGVQSSVFSRTNLFISAKKSDGFYNNEFNKKLGSAQNEFTSSVKNKWIEVPNTKIHSTHLFQNSNNAYDVWNANNSYVTKSDRPGQDNLTLQGHSLSIKQHLSERVVFKSDTSFAAGTTLYSYDADWRNNQEWQQVPGWNQNYDYFDSSSRRRTQWHQKLFLDGQNLSVGLHLYGLNEQSLIENFKNGALKNSLESRFSTVNSALVLYKAWRFKNQEWSLGLRQEWQELKYSDSQQIVQKENPLTWAHRLQWKHELTEESWWSLRWSRGFKNAGFNIDPDLTSTNRFYKPEVAQTYELEITHSQNRLTLFYQKQDDKQLKVSQQISPNDPSSFLYYTTSAGKTDGWGLEYSGHWIWARWQIETQVGLLRTQFRDYRFENIDYRGRDLAHAPRWSLASAAKYKWTPAWSTVVALQGRDQFYYSNNHANKSKPSTVVNLSIERTKQNWQTALWIKNLADSRTTVRGFYFANEPPEWQNRLYEQRGPPRHLLFTSTWQF